MEEPVHCQCYLPKVKRYCSRKPLPGDIYCFQHTGGKCKSPGPSVIVTAKPKIIIKPKSPVKQPISQDAHALLQMEPNVRRLILLRLDDKSLLKLCTVNKAFQTVCSDDSLLWQTKIQQANPSSLPPNADIIAKYGSWYGFYRNMFKQRLETQTYRNKLAIKPYVGQRFVKYGRQGYSNFEVASVTKNKTGQVNSMLLRPVTLYGIPSDNHIIKATIKSNAGESKARLYREWAEDDQILYKNIGKTAPELEWRNGTSHFWPGYATDNGILISGWNDPLLRLNPAMGVIKDVAGHIMPYISLTATIAHPGFSIPYIVTAVRPDGDEVTIQNIFRPNEPAIVIYRDLTYTPVNQPVFGGTVSGRL